MIIEQREPREVFTDPRPEYAYGQVYDAVMEFMEASQTQRPYAGLMLRDLMPPDLVPTMTHPHPDTRALAHRQTDYLAPINQAMHDAWKKDARSVQADTTNLTFSHLAVSHHNALHTDQELEQAGEFGLDRPKMGPLSAVTTVYGSVEYLLSIYPVDPFDSFTHHGLVRCWRDPDNLIRNLSQHRITAGPTDAIVFSNLPPTLHRAQAIVLPRLSIVAFSNLLHKEPLS